MKTVHPDSPHTTNQTQTMKLKNILIAAALLGGTSVAHADDRTFGDRTLPEFLDLYDTNDDGRIDEAERQAIKEARKAAREEHRAEIDTDGNGEITSAEREAARDSIREKIAEKRAEKFEEIAGEDGLLSPDEFAALPPLAKASAERVDSIFARLDADESGQVSLEEFNARLRQYGRPSNPGHGPGHGGPLPGHGHGPGHGDDKDKDKDKDKDDRPAAPPERPIGGVVDGDEVDSAPEETSRGITIQSARNGQPGWVATWQGAADGGVLKSRRNKNKTQLIDEINEGDNVE